MDEVAWWVPLVTLVLGAALAELRALVDRRQRARHEASLQSRQFAHDRRTRAEQAEHERRLTAEAFFRETLLALDDAVHEFSRTVVRIHLEQSSGSNPHERWWKVHVTGAREVHRLLARVRDQTLLTLVRATLNAGNEIIQAQEPIEHIAAMGLTQGNADDVSDRIGELLTDADAPQWNLKDSPAPGDGRYEPHVAGSEDSAPGAD